MFPKIVVALLIVALSAAVYRRRAPLPFAAVLLLTSIFFSRVYWLTGPLTLRFESLACLLLAATFGLDLWRKRIKPAFDLRMGLVLALFPVMIIPSAFASPSPFVSLKKTMIYVPYLLAFAALAHYLRRKGALRAAWDHFLAAGVLAMGLSAAGLVLFMMGLDLGVVRMAVGTLWLRGTCVIPNILGSTAVIVLVAAFMRLVSSRPKTQRGASRLILALIAASVCALTSMTRSAWLCAIAGTIAVATYGWVAGNRRRAVSGLGVILISLIATYGATAGIPARIGPIPPNRSLGEFGEKKLDRYWKGIPLVDRFNYLTKAGPGVSDEELEAWLAIHPGERASRDDLIDKSLATRRRTARAALLDWRSSPIIGRGTESLGIIQHFRLSSFITSTWISILHDWGLLGLGLHLAFLLLAFLGLVRAFRRAEGSSAKGLAFSLILVLALSTTMYQSATTMQISVFWVLLAFYSAGAAVPPRQWEAEAPAGLSD